MELDFEDIRKVIQRTESTDNMPELFGRRFGYSNPRLPGFLHIHHMHDYSVKYMDPELCIEFDASLEEIRALGAGFQALVTHPQDIKRVYTRLMDHAALQDEKRILTFFQRIHLRPEGGQSGYNLVVTSVRLHLADKTFVCISNTTDQLPVFSTKISNALNNRFESRHSAKMYARLTRREKEVFELLAGGNTAKQIADDLALSVRTMEQHKKNIYKKLEVNSLAEVVSIANALDYTGRVAS